MPSVLDNLNPQQKKAVLKTEGPVLVLAGPGSGKTKVLTTRIAYILDQQLATPMEILGITFTNKASQEIKERVQKSSLHFHMPWLGTFHSISSKILRRELPPGNKDFTIYDTDDSVNLIKRIIAEMGIFNKELKPSAVLSAISQAKNELISPLDYQNYAKRGFYKQVSIIYKAYQKRLQENNALDFSDLLYKTVLLLKDNPEVLNKYQNLFKYILVDEYQDTNTVQYYLIKMLAKKHKNIFVVGDMAQSIYSWRGANYKNILNYKNDYPKAYIVNLTQNYRSTANIISAAKEVIKHNKNHISLDLWTSNDSGEKIKLYEAHNEREEAEYIVKSIIQSKIALNDTAVLYRTNAQSRIIEEYFVRYGIPYVIVGGLKFYSRKEIKDLLSYLRVIQNPSDSVSWNRILNIPPRGIGPKTLQKIAQTNYDLKIIQERTNINFYDYIKNKNTLPPKELLESIISTIDYMGYLNKLGEDKDRTETRKENIKELLAVAKEFNNLQEFLENVALVDSSEQVKSEESVTLMTLHSAKGLEFKQVFIVGLEEGLLPHSRSIDDLEQLEEERRLYYVGITRAKDILHITFARHRSFFGSTKQSIVSRFVAELPEDAIQSINGVNITNDSDFINTKDVDSFFSNLGL